MDYNSTFLGLIVAGVILVAIGFGMVLTQSSALRPASAIMATEKPVREPTLRTVGDERSSSQTPSQIGRSDTTSYPDN